MPQHAFTELAIAAAANDLTATRRIANELLPITRQACADAAAASTDPAVVARRHDRGGILPGNPLTLFGNIDPAAVRSAWHRQLINATTALAGFAANDRSAAGDWCQDWIEWAGPSWPFHRLEHLRDYLVEVLKLCDLLEHPVDPLRLVVGEPVAGSGWDTFGGGSTEHDGSLRMHGSGIAAWHRADIPANAVVSFRFTPQPTPGDRGGLMFAMPARPLTADGFAASTGPMERYNAGINTWHCSLSRGTSGVTNLRRTGFGLRMLSTVPDPCRLRGRTYAVALAVHNRTIQVHVDGALIHHYVDTGAHGPALGAGRFGIRLFAGLPMEATITDVRIAGLRIADRR